MRRLLLAGAGSGGTLGDPIAAIRSIVEHIPLSDAHGYLLYDDLGAAMNTLKVIDDPSGGYLGVYHIARTSPFDGTFSVVLAHSTDLATWTRLATLITFADQPYIGTRADGSFIVGYGDETVSPIQVALKRYTTRANLVAGTASDSVRLPRTRAGSGKYEVAPVFASIEDPMDIGFVYENASNLDNNARGTLTGWSGSSYTSWVTATAPYNAPVLALDSYIATAATEIVTLLGQTATFVGSQIGSGRFYVNYWDGSSAVVQTITTDAAEGDLDSLRCSIVASPLHAGRKALYCAMVIHDGVPEGPGCAWWYRELPPY